MKDTMFVLLIVERLYCNCKIEKPGLILLDTMMPDMDGFGDSEDYKWILRRKNSYYFSYH